MKLTMIAILLLTSGCATLTHRGRHQFVHVQSDPPGAEILADGNSLGTTPAVIELRRHLYQDLELRRLNETKTIRVKGKYSWSESFAKNLFLLSLAPIGWIVDLSTGTAWKYTDPEPTQFSNKKPIPLKPQRMAIAPPLSDDYKLSDEAASYWEKKLAQLYPKYEVIPYRETLSVFQDESYDYDERPSGVQVHRGTLYRLKTDHMFLSQVRRGNGGLELYGERVDLTGEAHESQASEKSVVQAGVRSSMREHLPSWFQFFPNTLGIDLSSASILLSDDLKSHSGLDSGGQSSIASGLSYLQAISLSHLLLPRTDREARWKFQFVPSASLAYKKVYFPTLVKLANVDFEVLQVSVGFGPEYGYQSGKHYTYFKILLAGSYTQIDWHQPGGSREQMSLVNGGVMYELGYLWFMTERLSMRVFAKSVSAGVGLWNDVAHKVNPTISPLTSATNGVAGLSFGYTFDTRDRVVLK